MRLKGSIYRVFFRGTEKEKKVEFRRFRDTDYFVSKWGNVNDIYNNTIVPKVVSEDGRRAVNFDMEHQIIQFKTGELIREVWEGSKQAEGIVIEGYNE